MSRYIGEFIIIINNSSTKSIIKINNILLINWESINKILRQLHTGSIQRVDNWMKNLHKRRINWDVSEILNVFPPCLKNFILILIYFLQKIGWDIIHHGIHRDNVNRRSLQLNNSNKQRSITHIDIISNYIILMHQLLIGTRRTLRKLLALQ